MTRDASRNNSSVYICSDALVAFHFGDKSRKKLLDSCKDFLSRNSISQPFFMECIVLPYSDPKLPQSLSRSKRIKLFNENEKNIFYFNPKKNFIYAISKNLKNNILYPKLIESQLKDRIITFSSGTSDYYIDIEKGTLKEIYLDYKDQYTFTKHSPGYCKSIKKPKKVELKSIKNSWW